MIENICDMVSHIGKVFILIDAAWDSTSGFIHYCHINLRNSYCMFSYFDMNLAFVIMV